MLYLLAILALVTIIFCINEYKKLKPTGALKPNKSNIVTCLNCSMGFKSYLEKCPHCNYENKNYRRPMSNSAAILIGIAALFCLSFLFGEKSDSNYSENYLSINACKDVIKPSLKNPDSADFDTENAVVSMHDDNKISVYITVRATNSYNAVVPTNFSCWVNKSSGRYIVDSIEQVSY